MEKETSIFSTYMKSLRDAIVVQVILTVGVAVVGAIITFFVSTKLNFNKLDVFLLVALVMTLIGIISYVIYRRSNKRLPHFDTMDCNFQMLKEERVHRWIDKDNYIHKRRYKLKALKDGLTHYTDKFQWTGPEYTLSGRSDEYTVKKQDESKNVFDIYDFKFTTPLKKNDIIEVEAMWTAKGPAKPFFSTTIEEPTDLLVMTVILYPGSGITKINCDIESYKGARVPIVSKKETLNSDGEFTWIERDPKLLYHYEINWKTLS
jgi:hypothetical protein